MRTLREIIHENVCEGELYEKLDRNWVRCFACGHCCKIPEGQPGVCKVRYNRAEPCLCPGAMSAASNATPSRKNPSSMLILGHWLTASECSAVIYTALTARIG